MTDVPETTSRRGLLVGLAVGLPVIAYGLRGAIVDAGQTRPAELVRWVIGAALVNDLAVVPAAIAVALVARRFTPRRAWPPVRAGLAATGVLALVGWPLVRGYGDDPTIPSLLPRDYGTGLAVAIGVIWLAVGLWIAWRTVRTRGRPDGDQAASPNSARTPRSRTGRP